MLSQTGLVRPPPQCKFQRMQVEAWHVVGVTTKKQLLVAPPAAIILQ
jgi:hypothetical protein